ncbi:MAG: WYL domain-containing protein [Clostridia bacterium]|nr:WYL domain-containing protein [Clostridia bacterium]
MSAYSELIKSFEKIRAYIRDFYLYGFKSREEYRVKSARSYDDERRRLESWLGDHMRFVRTPEGKNVFISIDSRTVKHNPLYNAWKAKSFTDGDITLHFILFDILYTPSVKRSVAELLEEIDGHYLSGFESPLVFDESTLRKKLKEYCEAGLLATVKEGRRIYYHRQEDTDLSALGDLLHYFSEVAPCGVIGSFLLDKEGVADSDTFSFKHHYITGSIDSGVLAALFSAMREKRAVSVSNTSPHKDLPRRLLLVPLRILISAQSGRQHLLAYLPSQNAFLSYRIDYLSSVKPEAAEPRFDALREELERLQRHAWGVNIKRSRQGARPLEHVEFTVRVEEGEKYIVKRLLREKRIGEVTQTDERTYRFSADVYDTGELIPWIRTFLCRIVRLHFSNRTVENRFKQDVEAMYALYGIGKEASE